MGLSAWGASCWVGLTVFPGRVHVDLIWEFPEMRILILTHAEI